LSRTLEGATLERLVLWADHRAVIKHAGMGGILKRIATVHGSLDPLESSLAGSWR